MFFKKKEPPKWELQEDLDELIRKLRECEWTGDELTEQLDRITKLMEAKQKFEEHAQKMKKPKLSPETKAALIASALFAFAPYIAEGSGHLANHLKVKTPMPKWW